MSQVPEFMPSGTRATPGMPCTKTMGSDSFAATVTSVGPGARSIVVSELRGRSYTATLRRDGYYHKVGDAAEPWNAIMLGTAEDHADPHR
jgi:hypothetical protein